MLPDRYAVIGNPIAHSRSPDIHQLFAQDVGMHIEYDRVLAPLDAFADTVSKLIADGYKGANVTVPFKLQAYALANRLTERAMYAGAVNTLIFSKEGILGDNTDGIGLVNDIQANLGIAFKAKCVLLIGAGGAAEGVLHPILAQDPARLVIANRTLDKALNMVKKVMPETSEHQGEFRRVPVNACAFEDLHGLSFDIVINATSAGLTDTALHLPQGIFAKDALAYDMVYGRETPFMAFARGHGAATVAAGLGMLVEQAAEAFYLWNHIRPATKPVIKALNVVKVHA